MPPDDEKEESEFSFQLRLDLSMRKRFSALPWLVALLVLIGSSLVWRLGQWIIQGGG